MARQKAYASNAARQSAYRERKRNTERAQAAPSAVTFEEVFSSVPMVAQSSSDDQYTPRWVLDAARQVLGGIDLDPATSAAAQAVVCAKRYYTQADNGLLQSWAGRVWCNPPYSDPLPWVKKLIGHYRAGEVSAALLLLNIAGTPEWARLLWQGGYPVCILADRIEFATPDGRKRPAKNMYDQFIWYFGRRPGRFAQVFAPYGAIR